MPTVGEQLRSGREAQKLTLQQVAETTKMRTDHIRAVEEGRFDVFVAPVYLRGFVRGYAKLLKLDVPGIMAALDQEIGSTEKFREQPHFTRESRGILDLLMLQFSKLNRRKGGALLLVIGIVLAALLLGWVWRQFQKGDSTSGTPPPAHQPNSSPIDRLPPPRG